MNEKKHKKIEVVVKYFYPVAAGIETNILETYCVLVKDGWDVTIHTSNLDYTTGKILPENETIKGIKVVRYPLTRYFFKPKIPLHETNLVCLHNFDILPHFLILAKSSLAKLLGRKSFSLVVTPHGGFNPEWTVFPKVQALIKYFYHYAIGTHLINYSVDAVRAVSNWELNEMVKKGVNRRKVVVISNGIEDEAFSDIENLASQKIKDTVQSFGDYILQIGRIYPIKNYETTIKALSKVQEDIKFVIAGPLSDEKYLLELRALSKKLGLGNRVIFAGVVRGVDKYYLIKQAKLMVHMAIWESFCNVIHEAMSQGLPIIAANNTALRFLVKDRVNGFLVETKSWEALAGRINFLLEPKNGSERIKFSQNNLSFAKENTWAKTAEQMDSLYSSLIAGKFKNI